MRTSLGLAPSDWALAGFNSLRGDASRSSRKTGPPDGTEETNSSALWWSVTPFSSIFCSLPAAGLSFAIGRSVLTATGSALTAAGMMSTVNAWSKFS